MLRSKYKTQDEAIRNLKIGDIILVHWKEDFVSGLIRTSTASYWEHVAIVFDVPHQIDDGASLDEVLIVETSQSSALTLHRLQSYLRYTENCVLGFKRMPGLSDGERERFRGFFLDALGAPYDLKRILFMLIQILITWILHINISIEHAAKKIQTQRYTCTSLIQRAYYLAVDPKKRPQTLFRDNDKDANFIQKMEQITPGQIATSENTIWLHNPHN